MFPTVDGKVVAGPTAHDRTDKDDWSVRPEARAEVRAKAIALLPERRRRADRDPTPACGPPGEGSTT